MKALLVQTSIAAKNFQSKFFLLQMAQTFSTGSFNVALDKGTLDALLCDESEEAAEKSRRMLSQVLRILSVNGRYVIVTLAQRHVLKFWLEHFTTETEFA